MSDLRQAQCTAESPFLIFVTGIPSKSTAQVVLSHFKRFGQVQMYRLPSDARGLRVLQNPASVNIKRGFCVLQALNEVTYKKVLSCSEPFLGRHLAVGPFRQGSALWSHNEHVNARRVILKKVSSKIREETLHQYLEEVFGPINRMYRFAAESSEKAAKKERSRKYNSYSVEFSLVTAAAEAAKDGFFFMEANSTPIIVERFQKKVIHGGDTNAPSLTHKISHRSSKARKLTCQDPKSVLTAENHHQHSGPDWSEPMTIEDIGHHNVKPTKKIYHINRENYSTQCSVDDLSNYRVRINLRSRGVGLSSGGATPSFYEGSYSFEFPAQPSSRFY